ncbi:MAG: SDR family oxidoreductase [Bacteriovoracia bacterium]
MKNNNSLRSSTVVITGASSGIGKAAALKFAEEGAHIVLASRNADALKDLAIVCENLGGKAIAVPTDVTNKDEVFVLFHKALDAFKTIDVWINNAGVGAIGEFTSTPLVAHEQVIKTNLFGPLYGCYAVLPYFKEKGKGTIINVNSTGSFIGNPYTVAYSASKFGLRGFSEALRFELKDFADIHVCDLFAAFVDTPAFTHAANYLGKEVKPTSPLIEPEKMAEAMVKLAKKPRPSIHIGAQDRLGRLTHLVTPEMTGNILNKAVKTYFSKAKEVPKSDGNLFSPPSSDNTPMHGEGPS